MGRELGFWRSKFKTLEVDLVFFYFVFGGSEVRERGLNFESEKCLDL